MPEPTILSIYIRPTTQLLELNMRLSGTDTTSSSRARTGWNKIYRLCEKFLASDLVPEIFDNSEPACKTNRKLVIDGNRYPHLYDFLITPSSVNRSEQLCDLVASAAQCMHWYGEQNAYHLDIPMSESDIEKSAHPIEIRNQTEDCSVKEDAEKSPTANKQTVDEEETIDPVTDDDDMDEFNGLVRF